MGEWNCQSRLGEVKVGRGIAGFFSEDLLGIFFKNLYVLGGGEVGYLFLLGFLGRIREIWDLRFCGWVRVLVGLGSVF